MDISALLIIFAGLFAICCAGLDLDWFMENYKARFMSDILGGRARARIFYMILGLIITIIGFLIAFDVFR
jgi:hypothetical protein